MIQQPSRLEPAQLTAVPREQRPGFVDEALFSELALSPPAHVERTMAELGTPLEAKAMLDEISAIAAYGKRVKAGIEVANSIHFATLLIKARLGKLLPRTVGGRGKRNPATQSLRFHHKSIATFRKIAANEHRLPEYQRFIEDHNSRSSDSKEITQEGFLRFCGSDESLHTKFTGNFEWYTPPEYVEAARNVMGSIDCDPASCEIAQQTVRANVYHTAEDDGLAYNWRGNIFLNPPFKFPLVADFAAKLCDEVGNGNVGQAVLLTNNSTDTGWWQRAARAAQAVCFVDGRICFWNASGKPSAPTNGQTFIYFGRRISKFVRAFSDFGLCLETSNKAEEPS
jgi:ParB family chromosome partitioning protein